MARVDTLGHFLTDVADAIRTKTGSSDTITASDFDTEIENIPSGSTINDVTTEADMEEIELSESTYGNMYNYTGDEGKYLDGLYEVTKEPLIVKNDAYYCPSGSTASYTKSINCNIGSKLIAFITFRNDTYSLSTGWTELGKSSKIAEQYMVVATKIAESTTESITATQGSSARMYINILEIPSTSTITFEGFDIKTSQVSNITASNQIGGKIYGLSAYYWTNYQVHNAWTCNNANLKYYGLPSGANIQQRQGVFAGVLEESTNVIFTPAASSTIILATISVTYNYEYNLSVCNKNTFYINEDSMSSSNVLKYLPVFRIPNSSAWQIKTYYPNVINIGYIDITGYSSAASLCGSLSKLKYIDKIINCSNVTNWEYTFYYCTALKEIPQFDTTNANTMAGMCQNCSVLEKIPLLNTANVTNLSNFISSAPNLSDESLDNVLQMCINSQCTTKTFVSLSTSYTESRLQSLPHYQDFINAGWTYN